MRNICVLVLFHLMTVLVSSFVVKPWSSIVGNSFQSETKLFDGIGVTKDFSWHEVSSEIEIKFNVPKGIKVQDISFKAKPLSIDLRIPGPTESDGTQTTPTEQILLDGNREMRGRICLDGTYWDLDDAPNGKHRQITVTVEKNIRQPRDDFEIVEYDWGGVYPNDDHEVISRNYTQGEELNIKEYAASLGVDIDNINMSLVDKTMFTSGLNLTKKTMEQFTKAGYMQEVTQQGDVETIEDKETGQAVPFSPYGQDTTDYQTTNTQFSQPKGIPFLDTDTPWKNSSPTYNLDELLKGIPSTDQDQDPNPSGGQPQDVSTSAKDSPSRDDVMDDSIDNLSEDRLREILEGQGIEANGEAEQLRDRLKEHVATKVKKQTKDLNP